MTRANAAAIALVVAASTVAGAGRTQTWSESAETLARGRAEGLALGPQGELSLAPRLTRLGGGEALPGGAQHAWSAAAQGDRDLVVGTGPGGGVLRLGPTGRAELLATVAEPMVTAVAPLADGSTLAASAPGGTIYRLANRLGSHNPNCSANIDQSTAAQTHSIA